MPKSLPTASHWGMGTAVVDNGRLLKIEPSRQDPAPSALLDSMVASTYSKARIAQPCVRKSYLEHGIRADRKDRGAEPFVAVEWDVALDLATAEIERVRRDHGNAAIFAGSYGWASAGRFHHAQSQIHRFYKLVGGYTSSVDNYSYAAALVIAPHVIGPLRDLIRDSTVWPVIRDHGDLVVMFGGVPAPNTQLASGGLSQHGIPKMMKDCRESGTEFVVIGPQRTDAMTELGADWIAPRPNTDTALMLGVAYSLISADLHDPGFIEKYTVGFDKFEAYLRGRTDGIVKSAAWAASICDVPETVIVELARRMARQRTIILTAASLQRADHGEQVVWMTIVLAAMLGQIGLPGGGFGFAYGSDGIVGAPINNLRWPSLPQGANPIESFIPVARIADMLLEPGRAFDYNGSRLTYPDIRLVHWAGGNPFHHHQDINRLIHAFHQPETIIVNEISWTATARHADIVFPITTTLERNDICMNRHDDRIVAMKRAIEPVGQPRNDFDVFSGLAERLEMKPLFTEDMDEAAWLRRFWRAADEQARLIGLDWPSFDEFWERGYLELPLPLEDHVMLRRFREDPVTHPLSTPSGRIEIFSKTIDGFGYDDCPGHPVWLEPFEWLGSDATSSYPLHLISGQPGGRLHSQLDDGPVSQNTKINGREPIRINPEDAQVRGLIDGDIVRVFNHRGACLAGVRVSQDLRRGVVELKTGAWFDPIEPGVTGSLDVHGTPNVLTRDKGTSQLAQGSTAHTTLVQVQKYEGWLPEVTVLNPPMIIPIQDV